MSDSNSIPMPTHPRFVDRTGQVFSRLTVTRYAGKLNDNCSWVCLCECGNTTVVAGKSLASGNTRSCGCLHIESVVTRSTKHGGHGSQEYTVWSNMWERTTNPNRQGYAKYSTRRPPDSWRDFANFLKDMGPIPMAGLTIDRIDNSKPYGPGNCRWATMKVQGNNKGNNALLTHEGLTMSITQWGERLHTTLGVSPDTLRGRLRLGWSVDRALTTPIR